MASKDMLDETKKILEQMNESEEKVISMREDLNQNNTFCQQIIDNLKELRQLRNKNTTELEDNQHLKNNIKKFNQQLLDFAQMIYHYMQEGNSTHNRDDTELGKIEEFLLKNRSLQEEKNEKYKITQATLIQQLGLMKTKELESISKKALESEALTAENHELEREIEIISQQIECGENDIKNEVAALDDEKEFEKTIENLQEPIEDTKREINEFQESLEEVKEIIRKLESEGDRTLSDLDQKIGESETEIKAVSSDVSNCQLTIDEAAAKIEILEGQIRNGEEECNNYKSEINRIELNIVKLEEDYKKNIIVNEQSVTENNEKCKEKRNLTEQIKADICAYKGKIEVQQQNIDTILKCLGEYKPNTDLRAEIDEQEDKLRQLKYTGQQLQQDYDSRLSEVETQINQGRQEIETLGQTNRKLVDTDALNSELNLKKTRLEQMSAEKEQRNRDKAELENEIQSLSLDLDRTRKNKKRLANTSIQTKETISTSAKGKDRRIRHWDSDSSIESEDRRFSELIKRKIKMQKVTKSNT